MLNVSPSLSIDNKLLLFQQEEEKGKYSNKIGIIEF
jgi:hypothetical protein